VVTIFVIGYRSRDMSFWVKGNARRHKYGNAIAGGSKLEESVYQLLALREKAGEIEDLKRQSTVVLQDGPRNVRITWRIDFEWVNKATGETEYGEAKGVETEVYKLKLKLFRKNPPGRLEIWKGHHTRPRLVEVVG